MVGSFGQAGTATVAAPPLRWTVWQILATLGLLVAIIVAVLGFGDGTRVSAAARGLWLRPELLTLFLASYSAAFFLRALAWRLLLPSKLPPLRLFAILQIALLANHLFPTKAGEVVRAGMLTRYGVGPGTAASSTMVARLLDFTALCLIALGLGPLAGGRLDLLLGLLALPIASTVMGAIICLLVASGSLDFLAARLPGQVMRVAGDVQTALAMLSSRSLLAAFAMVVPSWLLESGALWVTAEASGVPLSLPAAAAATAFTIAFQAFQVTPGGLGLYEASLTGALALYAIEPTTGLALALGTHGLKFAYAYLVGFPCLAAESVGLLGRGVPGSAVGSWLRQHQRALAVVAALARRCATAWGRWDIALVVAGVAVATTDLAMRPIDFSAGGLLVGLVATMPLAALGRCHHLPRQLVPALLVVPLGFVALFGPPAMAAGLLALALGAIVAGWQRTSLSVALWSSFLAGSVAAGAERPLAVGLFGLAALVLVVLGRQWWLAHHPLPRPAPPPPGSTIVVLIPVHNEAATVGSVVAGVPRSELGGLGLEIQVIVVDDGSTDGSGAIAVAAGADEVIRHSVRRGLGAALRTGLDAARARGAAAVVYLDGDAEYDPAEIPAVISPIVRGEADYVLGTRFPRAAHRMSWSRRWGNRAFTALLWLLTGRRLRDGQTGFRAFSARALVQAEIIHSYNYAQVLTLDLLRKRLRLAEIPIGYQPRRHGRSFIRYREYLRRVVPAIVQEVLGP